MLLLDYEERGWQKNPIKQGFFFVATPFLREGKGRKEERGQRSKKTPQFLHQNVFGGLRNGQEVVPPFWGPKIPIFQVC